jgi:hypothetical protein
MGTIIWPRSGNRVLSFDLRSNDSHFFPSDEYLQRMVNISSMVWPISEQESMHEVYNKHYCYELRLKTAKRFYKYWFVSCLIRLLIDWSIDWLSFQITLTFSTKSGETSVTHEVTVERNITVSEVSQHLVSYTPGNWYRWKPVGNYIKASIRLTAVRNKRDTRRRGTIKSMLSAM